MHRRTLPVLFLRAAGRADTARVSSPVGDDLLHLVLVCPFDAVVRQRYTFSAD